MRAGALGNPMAELQLGYQNEFGEGMPQNFTEAARWVLPRQSTATRSHNEIWDRSTKMAKAFPKIGCRRQDGTERAQSRPIRKERWRWAVATNLEWAFHRTDRKPSPGFKKLELAETPKGSTSPAI